MNDPVAEPPLSALRSASDFESAVKWSIGHALHTRARRLTWLDPDFANWPLNDPALLEALGAWLRLPQRRLVMLAHDYAMLERRQPRFVAWRRNWAHAVEPWSPSVEIELRLPTLLIDDDRLCVQLFDSIHWRGRLSLDERAVRQWHDEIDVILQRCEAAFPVHHLGL